jgi:predicted MFS family arabinose efflux permease
MAQTAGHRTPRFLTFKQALELGGNVRKGSRLTAGYMIFYSIGCATGSIVSTLVYARAGWTGVCLLGAAISAIAFVFWALTRHLSRRTLLDPRPPIV